MLERRGCICKTSKHFKKRSRRVRNRAKLRRRAPAVAAAPSTGKPLFSLSLEKSYDPLVSSSLAFHRYARQLRREARQVHSGRKMELSRAMDIKLRDSDDYQASPVRPCRLDLSNILDGDEDDKKRAALRSP